MDGAAAATRHKRASPWRPWGSLPQNQAMDAALRQLRARRGPRRGVRTQRRLLLAHWLGRPVRKQRTLEHLMNSRIKRRSLGGRSIQPAARDGGSVQHGRCYCMQARLQPGQCTQQGVCLQVQKRTQHHHSRTAGDNLASSLELEAKCTLRCDGDTCCGSAYCIQARVKHHCANGSKL